MKKAFFIIGLTLLAGCSKFSPSTTDGLFDEHESSDLNFISTNQAKEITLDFVRSLDFDNGRKGLSEAPLSISSVSHILRKNVTKSVQNDTLMHIVNLENKGYTIISGINIENPVLAYVPDATYDENSENPGTDIFIPYAENYLNSIDKTISDIPIIVVRPDSYKDWSIYGGAPYRLKVNWRQTYPYNLYVNDSYPNYLYYAGCVPVAVAQILSFCEPDLRVPGLDDKKFRLDWCDILAECKQNKGEIIHDNSHSGYERIPQYDNSKLTNLGKQVLSLVSEIGRALNARYTDTSTSANSEIARSYIESCSINTSKMMNYDATEIGRALEEPNKIIYIEGFTKDDGETSKKRKGHAWVIDGYLQAVNKKDNKDYTLVHCNWGYGLHRNGFYASEAFDVYNERIFDDESGSIIIPNRKDAGYNYNLHYFIAQK